MRDDTYRTRTEQMDRMAKEATADMIRRYRASHPEATGTDKAVLAVMQIEMLAGRWVEVVEAPW